MTATAVMLAFLAFVVVVTATAVVFAFLAFVVMTATAMMFAFLAFVVVVTATAVVLAFLAFVVVMTATTSTTTMTLWHITRSIYKYIYTQYILHTVLFLYKSSKLLPYLTHRNQEHFSI
jgi:hypothetical protein